jgi:membrane protease YdiL (CAAX protease family)
VNSETLDSAAPPSGIRPRDRMPLWVVILAALFLVVRVYDVGIDPFLHHPAAVKVPAAQAKQSGGSDSESMSDLLQTDLQAKSAFVQSLEKSGTTVKPDVKALGDALKAAKGLERESSNSPAAARRVILLRALINAAEPGKGNLPPLAADRNGLAPLDAFSNALPPDTPAPDRAQYAAEARLWQTVFQGGRLSPRQTAAAAAQIRRIPNIRWWADPALSVLYTQQGDLSEANRYAKKAQETALPSLVPFGLIALVRFGFILVGIVLLIYFVIRAVQRSQDAAASAAPPIGMASYQDVPPPVVLSSREDWPPTPSYTAPDGGAGNTPPLSRPPPRPPTLDLWPTVPPSVSLAQRRLGAGDLMGVFVLYLLTREVIGVLLTGFSGFGIPHVPHFLGLLAPFRPAINRMPASERTTVGIVLESAVYLLSAVPPVIMLWTLARQRGASLADEIGWTRRRLGLNLVYGLGGFAVASALMLPVALLGGFIFKHAPDPSNPVIPQLISTSGFWGPFLLVTLASLAAPVVEELLFRGVLYPALKIRLGVWPGIVLTGAIFGFIHPVGIAEMLAIGTLGGVFAWMAETRKSLAPSMFAHFLQNFTTTMLLLSVLSG